jgi:HEAT repeat protein
MNGCPRTLLLLLSLVAAGCAEEPARPPRDTSPPAPKTVADPNEPIVAGRPLSAWVKELKGKDPGERRSAALFLGSKGNTFAVPHLIPLLKDSDIEVRDAAARALGRIGPEGKAAIGPLIEALKDSDDEVKAAAAEALEQYRYAARAAVPALTELVKSKNNKLRAYAGRALIHIDSEAAQKAGVELP